MFFFFFFNRDDSSNNPFISRAGGMMDRVQKVSECFCSSATLMMDEISDS